MFRSSDDHHQGAFWSWLKSLVKMWVFKCGYAAAYVLSFCMLSYVERHVDMPLHPNDQPLIETCWSDFKCLVCDIWINVLLQKSALVGPLYKMNWSARWNSEKRSSKDIYFINSKYGFLGYDAALIWQKNNTIYEETAPLSSGYMREKSREMF
jgi:hypothetical protein